MHKNRVLSVLFPWLLLAASPSLAQDNFGGGSYISGEDGPPLTEVQRKEIWGEINLNRAALRSAGILPSKEAEAAAALVAFGWPLSAVPSYPNPGYHGISNFFDHNAAFPNQLQDYECGTRTYDTATGYNHAGIDYFLWPFSWNLMDSGTIQIVAAAAGTLIYKHDGEFDRSCQSNNNLWNAVAVQHADGSVAWYGHMKKNSLILKPVGATVAQGETLGLVGSSGNSTGPHLHFEVYDSLSNLIDPYSGACNVTASWWASQRPYYDSAINRLATGHAPPVLSACNNEVEGISNAFLRGATIYFSAYYRDQLSGQNGTYTIYRPDNSVYFSWNHSSPQPHYSASYWYWFFPLPSNAQVGTWEFEVVYQGVTHSHAFEVATALPTLGTPGLVLTGLLLLVLGTGGALGVRRRSTSA